MAVRWKKYHALCKGRRNEGDRHGKVVQKGIACNGKRGNYCPEGVPSPCGVWAIDYREIDGRWISKVFPGISKTEAKERLEDIKSNIRRGIVGLPQLRKTPTLAEYALKYLELNKTAKENTLAMKKRAIGVLIRYLGEYTLNKVTPFVIEKFRVERKEKDGVKDSVINIDCAVLTHLFNTAIDAGILDKNPCQKVKRLKVTQVKDRILSQSEIAMLFDKLQGKDRCMVLTGRFTGMRLNEVLGLSWNDIDSMRGVIQVHQSKTRKTLDIPLSDYLRNELEAYRTHSTGDRVFESRDITHSVVSEYSGYFSNLFKCLGIHNFTFHNLRHTFSSILQGDLGIGAVVVQGMTGHSSLGMLQKYSHTGMNNKRTAIQALTDHVLGASEKKVLSIAR